MVSGCIRSGFRLSEHLEIADSMSMMMAIVKAVACYLGTSLVGRKRV
jgi:hypothetical protein